MPLMVRDPRSEFGLLRSVTGTSRQKSIVIEIKGLIGHLSNSGAKHLHEGFFKGPKPGDGARPVRVRELDELCQLSRRHDVAEPFRTGLELGIRDVDTDVPYRRYRDDRHLRRMGTAEFKVVSAVRERRLSELRAIEAPVFRLGLAADRVRKRATQQIARLVRTLARTWMPHGGKFIDVGPR